MSRLFVGCTSVALLLAAACAEGAQGAGTGSGATGSGGDDAARGGSGPGGSGGGGSGQGASGEGGQPTGQGGDGGAPQGSTGSGSSTSTVASSVSASAMSSSSTGQVEPGTVFFSEYIEGSGNNKALEIYNAGSTSVDLGNCHLDRYQNGATSSLPELFLDAVNLLSGNVFVICQSNFGDPGRCDQMSADVQHSGDRSEPPGFDRIDQGACPLPSCAGEIDVPGRAAAALGDMRRRAAFARIDNVAREQGLAPRGEAHRLGAREAGGNNLLVEVSLRPVEIDPGNLETEPAQPVGVAGKQRVEPLGLIMPGIARHYRSGHNGQRGYCHPGLTLRPPAQMKRRCPINP